MQRGPDCRKQKQCDGIQNKDCTERDGHLFFAGVGDGPYGRNGTSATNRRSGRDQERRFLSHSNEVPEHEPNQHNGSDADRGVDKARAAYVNDFMEVHAKAKPNDRSLQEEFGQTLAFRLKWMREDQTVEESTQQGEGRRDQSAGCQNNPYEEEALFHSFSVDGEARGRPSSNFNRR